MTLVEQFNLALEFMLLGMGVVFVFLSMLVFIVKWMGGIILRIQSRNVDTSIQLPRNTASEAAIDEQTLVAVIGAAVHQYQLERS